MDPAISQTLSSLSMLTAFWSEEYLIGGGGGGKTARKMRPHLNFDTEPVSGMQRFKRESSMEVVTASPPPSPEKQKIQ